MAVRIIDPREMFSGEQRDKFEVRMHSNLCVPSFMHAYSMAVEFARDWFLSKMPVNYFRKEDGHDSITINEKNIFDDYRRLSKAERLAKTKPYLIITPQINFDFDLDTVHMYNYGPELLTRRGWQTDSFFRDGERGLYLLMNMQLIEVKVDYKISMYSRALQLDLFKKMEIWFRIGATETQDRDMDFHIPSDIIYNIADAAGFKVNEKTKQVEEPLDFARYMNGHSEFPIMYKFRKATGNFDFFMRVPMLPVHVDIQDKLRPDDGEMQGQIHTNYNIEMSATFRMAVPQFYVYYTKDPVHYDFSKQERDDKERESFDLCTFKVVDIPLVNSRGWEKFVWSKYEYDDEDNGIIDLDGLIGSDKEHSEFYNIMKTTIDAGLSPSVYIDLTIFTADPSSNDIVNTEIDWDNNKIIINDDLSPQILYIAMYVDLDYYNRTLQELDRMRSNRMVQHKDQMSKEMMMSGDMSIRQ